MEGAALVVSILAIGFAGLTFLLMRDRTNEANVIAAKANTKADRANEVSAEMLRLQGAVDTLLPPAHA